MFLAASESGGGSVMPLLLMLAALAAMTYFLIIRPNSKRRKEMMETQSALEPGAEVITIGGLHGVVAGVSDETIDIEISPGVTARFARGAIARVVKPETGVADPEETVADTDNETDETKNLTSGPVSSENSK